MNHIQTLKKLGTRPVLYAGEIGRMPGALRMSDNGDGRLYKYGITGNAYRRIVYSHMKRYEYFDLKLIKETEFNRRVESMLTEALKREKIHFQMSIDGKVQRELFYLKDPVSQLDWFHSLVEDLAIKAERGALL